LADEQSARAELARSLAQQEEAREALARELADSRDEATAREDARGRLAEDLAQQRAQVETLSATLADEQSARAELARSLAQQEEAREALARELADSRREADAQREIYKKVVEVLQSVSAEKKAMNAAFSAERDDLNREIAQARTLLEEADLEKADISRRLRETERALEQAESALTERQHDLAQTSSMLRQREEEIHQTLAALDQLRHENSDTKRQFKVVSAKLKAADEWVFQLAGDRKAAEDRATLAGKRLATAEKALGDATARLDLLERQHLLDQQDLERLRSEVDGALKVEATLLERMEAVMQSVHDKDADVASARSELAEAQAQSARHRQNAESIAARLQQLQVETDRRADQAHWLRNVNSVVTSYPRWWTLMPAAIQSKWRQSRLRRRGLFDAEAYLNRYPDVSSSGMDPLRHYILHGMDENRTL
jgi:chromosome segregation ATPase